MVPGFSLNAFSRLMNNLLLVRDDGKGWLKGSVAQRVYGLSEQEFNLIKAELKGTGAICPRKGIAIGALERVVSRIRMETEQ